MRRQLYLFLIFNIGFTFIAMSQEETGFLFGEFKEATIHFSGGFQSIEKVNYNILDKELYFIDKNDGLIRIVTGMDRIRIVRIDNRNFIPVKTGMHEAFPTTPPIFVEYMPKVQKKGQQVGYGGTSQVASTSTNNYLENQNFIFPQKKDYEATSFYNCYWIELNGKKKKFANFNQFLKIYPKHKSILDGRIKTDEIEFNDTQKVIDLCLYAESLN